MNVLIEIKDGIITSCYSDSKNVLVQVLDYGKEKDIPELREDTAENLGRKGLKRYVESCLDNE